MNLVHTQVSVVCRRVVRNLASDNLREFLQLTGIAVCLHAKVYGMAS